MVVAAGEAAALTAEKAEGAVAREAANGSSSHEGSGSSGRSRMNDSQRSDGGGNNRRPGALMEPQGAEGNLPPSRPTNLPGAKTSMASISSDISGPSSMKKDQVEVDSKISPKGYRLYFFFFFWFLSIYFISRPPIRKGLIVISDPDLIRML